MKEKKIHIEVLRIIAILTVIFNHTGGITAFTAESITSIKYFLYLISSLVCKVGVPIFFMISGAMLLGKNIGIKGSLKRAVRMAIFLVLITLLNVIYKLVRYGVRFTLTDVLLYLYTGQSLSAPLWFMYAYIAFLLSIPLLDLIVDRIKGDHVKYILSVAICIKIIDFIQFLLIRDEYSYSAFLVPSWLFTDIIIYPIVGYFIEHKCILTKKLLIMSVSIGTMGLCAEIVETTIMGVVNGGGFEGVYSQKYHMHFVLFITLAVYVVVNYIFRNNVIKSDKRDGMIRFLGGCTFGVYIIHIMVKDLKIMQNFLGRLTERGIDYIVSCWIYVVVTYFVCIVIVATYKHCYKRMRFAIISILSI